MDDVELLRRYVELRSEGAFAELVRRHVDLVYAAALRQSRNAHRAQDVTQAVFTDLARKAATLCDREEIVGWLYTCTHYAATKLVRSEARRERREREAQLMQTVLTEASDTTEWERLKPVLDHALCALNEPDRTAILLRFFKDRSFAEVGAALRLTEDGARKRVDRALDKLHVILERRGIRSTAAALALAMSQHTAVAAPTVFAAGVSSTALAHVSAAGATGSAVGFFVFMCSTKWVTGIAAAVIAFALSSAVYELRATNRVGEALRTVERESAALGARRAELITELARAEQDHLTTASAKAPTNTESAVTVTPMVPDAALEELRHDPEARRLATAYLRHKISQHWRLLYVSLELTPQQVTRFEDILVADSLSRLEWKASRSAAIFNTGAFNEPSVEAKELLHEVLGDAGFENYKLLQRSFGLSRLVDQLAEAAFDTDEHLTPQQAAGMALSLARDRTSHDDHVGINYSEPDWDHALAEARRLLSPSQMKLFQEIASREQARQAESRMRWEK